MSKDIRVGDCIVRPQRRLIDRGDESIHITPRAMSVFECLAAAHGTPVSRSKFWKNAETFLDMGSLVREMTASGFSSTIVHWCRRLTRGSSWFAEKLCACKTSPGYCDLRDL